LKLSFLSTSVNERLLVSLPLAVATEQKRRDVLRKQKGLISNYHWQAR